MQEIFLTPIITGLVTLTVNLIFYVWVKSSIEEKLETYKIAYTGVFSEKIEVHKELLKRIYSFKSKLKQYGFAGGNELMVDLFKESDEFINYYLVNQPFIKPSILELIKNLNKEYQLCFEAFHEYNVYKTAEVSSELLKQATFKALGYSKSLQGIDFTIIEDAIIKAMREDLQSI